MRLLILTPHFPEPPHGGALIRTREMVRYLGTRHQLTLVCFCQRTPQLAQRQALQPFCHQLHCLPMNQVPGTHPLESSAPYAGPALQAALQAIAEENQFDLVVVEFIHLAHWAGLFACPTVLCEHNIESELFRQLASQQTAPLQRLRWQAAALKLAAYEERMWPQFGLCCVVSASDREKLQQRCPNGSTVVVENGADARSPMLGVHRDSRQLLFSGLLNYAPNRAAIFWLASELMPRLWRMDENYRLVIAGSQPDADVLQLQAEDRIRVVANPPSMADIARDCSLLVVPLRHGSGTRVKILEAFAWGLPVVSTRIGHEGLLGEHGRHLWLADSAEDFVAAIAEATGPGAQWQECREQARLLCEQHYDWGRIWERLDQQLQSLARKVG